MWSRSSRAVSRPRGAKPAVPRDRATGDGRVGDGDDHAAPADDGLAVELELDFSLEHEVELLLSARRLVVCLDERLAAAGRGEDVGPECSQPEDVLERAPVGIVVVAARHRRHVVQATSLPTSSPRKPHLIWRVKSPPNSSTSM